ncbi:MAG: hypothetical protein JWO03_3436 [Bacteroidetes bacterium]|nr:hypothetical protein [Bacteroidota bacterium]
MKSILLALLSLSLIYASKDKPVQKPKPEYFGAYAKADKPDIKEWTLKPLAKDSNKIAFYHNKDVDFMFYVVMKDSTHFGTKSAFAQQLDGQPTQYWSAKGEFLPGGQMKIAVKTNDAGLKLSVDLEAQEKVLYIKK